MSCSVCYSSVRKIGIEQERTKELKMTTKLLTSALVVMTLLAGCGTATYEEPASAGLSASLTEPVTAFVTQAHEVLNIKRRLTAISTKRKGVILSSICCATNRKGNHNKHTAKRTDPNLPIL